MRHNAAIDHNKDGEFWKYVLLLTTETLRQVLMGEAYKKKDKKNPSVFSASKNWLLITF